MKRAWKSIALGSDSLLVEMQPGYACGIKDVADGVVHLRMNNVTKEGVFDAELFRRIPKDIAQKQGKFAKKGDVIFVNTNSTELVGKSAVFPGWSEPCAFSNHLTKLRSNPEKLHPLWLHLCFRKLWQDGYFAANCVEFIGQSSFNKEQLRALEIPLPPLAEQRRLVTRIEALTSRLEQARELRRQTAQQAVEFLRAIINTDKKTKPTRMRELVSLRSSDVVVRPDEIYQFAGVYCFGRGVFKSVAKSGSDFAYPRLTRVKAGEFTYPKLMAWEGALGMVPPECDGCVVSPEFPVFEVNSDRVFPEVLDVYFRTPSVWPELAGMSVGTNVRRRRLNPQAFLDYEMALPTRETQIRLRKAWSKQTELRQLQTETEAELASFTPALLAKAFRGEL